MWRISMDLETEGRGFFQGSLTIPEFAWRNITFVWPWTEMAILRCGQIFSGTLGWVPSANLNVVAINWNWILLVAFRGGLSCYYFKDRHIYDQLKTTVIWSDTISFNGYLVNKTNRRTEFQFYWYYYSTCFGQSFCPSSGVLSLNRLRYTLCSCDRLLPGLGWNYGHNCIKCTKADVRLRTLDDGEKGCPKHVE
jgi:hypothetical protein